MDRIPCDCQAFKIQCPKSWALFTSISSLIPAPESSGSFKIPVAQRPSLTDSHLTGCGRAQSLVFFSPNYPSLVIGTLKFRWTQVESHAFPGIPNTAKPSCPVPSPHCRQNYGGVSNNDAPHFQAFAHAPLPGAHDSRVDPAGSFSVCRAQLRRHLLREAFLKVPISQTSAGLSADPSREHAAWLRPVPSL